jgi:hypothetical protein
MKFQIGVEWIRQWGHQMLNNIVLWKLVELDSLDDFGMNTDPDNERHDFVLFSSIVTLHNVKM